MKSNKVTSRVLTRRFFDSAFYAYYCVAAFSFYVAGMLKLTDHFLAENIAGYEFSGNYALGMGIFFCASVVYLHLARWRRWLDWRYYVLGAVVVFFPLVFFASSVQLMINPDTDFIAALNADYCQSGLIASSIGIANSTASLGSVSGPICGEAFATLVSSMSLRALPVVLTAPAMFWYFIIRPESLERASDYAFDRSSC